MRTRKNSNERKGRIEKEKGRRMIKIQVERYSE